MLTFLSSTSLSTSHTSLHSLSNPLILCYSLGRNLSLTIFTSVAAEIVLSSTKQNTFYASEDIVINKSGKDICEQSNSMLLSIGGTGHCKVHPPTFPEDDFHFKEHMEDLQQVISDKSSIMCPTNVDRQVDLWSIEHKGNPLRKSKSECLILSGVGNI